jgi:Putative  PD-(D/E)XK family member, (DUF4420)
MDMLEAIPSLREALTRVQTPLPNDGDVYRIATAIGPAFLARGRTGPPTLLVPLRSAEHTVGRSGGGFTLAAAPHVIFDHSGHRWEQPAAILDCTDERLADTFLVLVTDLARRMTSNNEEITWSKIVTWVEEWQMLLGRRARLSAEEQLGLWGELWVLSKAVEVDRLFLAWRGPEREPVDFFYDGAGLEIKVSRRAHVHHISQTQIDAPRGEHDAYLLSMWVGAESARGVSLAELVERLLNKLSDPVAFLRQLANVGYSPQDQQEYATRYVPLEAPLWFRAADVPRVRAFDDGISQLRYVVTLDVDTCLDRTQAAELCRHFCVEESALYSERVTPT